MQHPTYKTDAKVSIFFGFYNIPERVADILSGNVRAFTGSSRSAREGIRFIRANKYLIKNELLPEYLQNPIKTLFSQYPLCK